MGEEKGDKSQCQKNSRFCAEEGVRSGGRGREMLHFESTQGLCPGESTSGGSKRDSIVGAELVPGSVFFPG